METTMKTSVLALTAVVMCLLACGGFGAKKNETLSDSELQREFKKSWQETQTKYNGKEVIVLGSVASVSVFNDSATIHLATRTDSDLSGTTDITCEVDKADLHLFGNVKENDTIRVKGMMSVTESSMTLRFCKWIPLVD